MKKLLAVFLFLSSVFLLPSGPVFAQNKCGVNIGPNYSQVDDVLSLTKPGGWIVTLGTTGNCTNFESLFGKGLNVVIRAYNGGKAFTNEQALAWVATLGKLNTKGQKVYFMPWNEPNHNTECGGNTCTPAQVVSYVQELKNKLNEAGLLNTKVVLLSPMIDKLNPTFPSFLSVYNLGLPSSINEYDQALISALYLPCQHPTKTMNNCSYNEIGIPPSFYALEAGVAGTSTPPRYQDNEIRQMLDKSWEKWKNDGNFNMFAIFSYDPHRPGKWKIFSAPQTTGFYQNACVSGGVTSGGPSSAVFEQWLKQNESQLIPCGNTCGFAPKGNQSLCSATGESDKRKNFVPPSRVTTNDTIKALSDTVLLSQKSPQWPIGAVGSQQVTKGGFFDQFQDLTIPFARDLTEYLAGPFVYQYNTYIKEVIAENNPIYFRPLANLTPQDTQDQLRYNYWRGCFDGVFCSSKNIGSENCPKKENNECLFSDETKEIQDICPPPKKEFNLPPNCPQTQDTWKESWATQWAEVPLVANPRTEVKKSILMNTCPAPSHVSTTTLTRTPWVSALNDVSTTLNNYFSSKLQQEGAGLPSTLAKAKKATNPTENQPKLLASSTLIALAPSEEGIHLSAEPKYDSGSGQVSVDVKLYSDGCDGHFYFRVNGKETITDSCCLVKGVPNLDPFNINPQYTLSPFALGPGQSASYNYSAELGKAPRNCTHKTASLSCTYNVDASGVFSYNCGGGTIINPPAPTCAPPNLPNFIPADPNAEPIYSEGHTLLKEDRYIGCLEWEIIDGVPHCKKLKDQLEQVIEDPTWAEIDYPYLLSIYDNLASVNGIFQKLFKPNEIDIQDWSYAAESNVTYCLTDHPAANMIKGGSLEWDLIRNSVQFVQPPARCEKPLYTKGVRAFPPLIGGVFNAKLWVQNKMLSPNE